MIGQGSPKTSPRPGTSWSDATVRVGCQCALAVCLAVCLYSAAAGETMRVRIAWGGGAEQLWQGRIAVSEGALSEPRCLGIEADEPGSMWPDAGHLLFRQRSPRTYDGVDLLVTAPLDAKLRVEVGLVNGPAQPTRVEIPLSNLVEGIHNTDLDDRGNRLLIRRMADDKLRVTLKHDSLVFTPGETLRFALEPHLLDPDRQNRVRITIALMAARTSQDLRRPEEFVLSVGEPVSIEREVRLPEQEGIYELVITATNAPVLRLPQSSRVPIGWNKPLAQRKIQLVVLRPESPAMPAQTPVPPGSLVEIDPTSSKWWERLGKLPQWHRANWLWKGPLGNGHVSVIRHPTLGPVVQLTPPRDKGDVPWEAYSLPIDEPGRPYILEVDYPSDAPQTMGISIVEPNAAGAVLPIGIDSGVDQAEEVTGMIGPPQWNRHRIIFWPRTKAPLVLITNRRDREPAVYGKLRVYAVGDHLPRAFPGQGRPERLLAAYLDRPLFPENFSASEAMGPMSDLGVDDWVTFYEGGTRLVEYLNYVGYNGLMIGVLADGSTIYPSQLLEPTPRYDTGVFFETGQDPMRKDVLELLLRLFDRERIQLIPALEFGTPLPQLEALLRRGGPEVVGLQWIGPEGQTWQDAYPPQRGMAPYYNVLDPRVQEAMLAVVHELAARYARHSSFGGLSLQLSAYGYAQLPGPEWGLDDATIARFEQATRIRVPGEGPRRFAERARFLTGEHANEWLEWRADQLSRFYRRVQAEVAAVRPDSRLYLAGANLFAGRENERLLQPGLAKRLTMTETLLRMGIDARRYGPTKEIVLLRPERIAPRWSLGSQAMNLEIRQMPDVDRYFQELPEQGSLFFHKPQETRLASFDAKSPFKPTYTWLATQPVPAGAQNRRRFVHSLATLDPQTIFDGGWELPLGQEDALRRLVAVYRRLPAIHFQRLADQPGDSSTQPVTIRYGTSGSCTYVYLVNDAPFASTVRVELAAGSTCRLEELSGLREVPPLAPGSNGNASWTVELGAYDLVGVRLSAPDVRLGHAQVSWPNEVQATLEARIVELGNRAAVLRRGPPRWDVLSNPGFERPVGANGQIPGWAATRQPGVTISLDKREKREGLESVRMESQGPVATLISEPFDPPTTGRVTISVWLRGAVVPQQPPVRVSLVGKHEGQDFYRFAYLSGDQAPNAFFNHDWGVRPITVLVNDLPLDGLSRLQLRFDLLGTGEVWIDDVQLLNLAFDKKEGTQLLKLIAPADAKLQRGDVGDCLELLEGYWPQFLVTHVPTEQNPVSQMPPGIRSPASRSSKEPPHGPGIMDRMKKYVPDRLRL